MDSKENNSISDHPISKATHKTIEKMYFQAVRNTLNSVIEASAIIDVNGTIIEFNQLCSNVVKMIFNKEIEIGHNKKEYLGEISTQLDRSLDVVKQGHVVNAVRNLTDKDGLDYWLEVKIAPFENPFSDENFIILSLIDITDLWLYNQELRKEKEKLLETNKKISLAYDTANMTYWEWDVYNDSYEIDNSWLIRNNISPFPDNANFEYHLSVVHPEDKKIIEGKVGEAIRAGKSSKIEVDYRLQASDKSWLWVHSKADLIIQDGKPVSFRGVTLNVNEQKQASLRLIRSETLFRSIWEESQDGMRLLDEFGRIVMVNKAFCRMVGIDREELEDFLFTKIYDLHQQIDKLKVFRERIKKGNILTNVERWIDLWNGERKWFDVSNAVIKISDEQNYVLSIFRDSTETKSKEQNLIELSSAVEQSPVSVIITDINGKIQYVNKRYTETSGYRKDDIYGSLPNVLKSEFHSGNNFIKLVDTLKQGERWNGDFKNRDNDGNEYWESASIFPVKVDDDDTGRFVVFSEDVSEKRQIQEELDKYIVKLEQFNEDMDSKARELDRVNRKLRESEEDLKQLNDSKDRFFSIIAHDLKGPFSAILGYSDFLKNDFDELSKDEAKEFASNIHFVAENVFNLLENLLDWSRLQSGRMPVELDRINILDILNGAKYLYSPKADEKSITLENRLKKPIFVEADGNMLTTSVRNLISNAVKFTPKDGIVYCDATVEDGYAIISVVDSGIGMSKEFQNNVFKIEVNTTTLGTGQEKGTGLGLVLCYELIEKIGGSIWVESELGKGTKFFIKLKIFEN